MHSFSKGDEGVFIIIDDKTVAGPGVITSMLRRKAGGARVKLGLFDRVVEVSEDNLFRSEIHARHALACRLDNMARYHRRRIEFLQAKSREARARRVYEDMEFDDLERSSGFPTTAVERALHEERP